MCSVYNYILLKRSAGKGEKKEFYNFAVGETRQTLSQPGDQGQHHHWWYVRYC